ncbi:hypothetical protein FOA52_012044, partial [Chlamydomonas sp. UWO 241]
GNSFGRKLRRVLMWTIVPAIITLNVGRAGVKVADVRSAADKVWGGVSSAARRVPKILPMKKAAALEPPPPPPPPPPPEKRFIFF